LSLDATYSVDLCVVGAGPAGIIVALEHAALCPEKRILLVDYGDERLLEGRNSLDDSICNLNPVNHYDPYECTNKGLGGTSATWGGRCVMYDEADFVPRPVYRGHCTWDEELLRELSPFATRAAEYFECNGGGFSLDESSAPPIAEGFKNGDFTDTNLERWSMPTRFGPRHREELKRFTNLTVAYGLEAREFAPVGEDGTVETLTARDRRTGQPVTIRSKSFVVAAGGQESTRLLLRNPGLFARRGGVPDSLGRFYQSHISGKIATVHFSGDPRKTDYAVGRNANGTYYRRRLQPSKELILRENLLNSAIWLDTPLYHDPAHGNGAMSFIYLAMITPYFGRRFAPPAIVKSVTRGKVNKVGAHLWNVLRDFPGSLTIPASIFFRRYCVRRKLPGIYIYNRQNAHALHFHAEQVPDPDNRMVLGPDGETLEIHYQYNEADVESVIRTHELLDRWLQKCGCGKLEYWWPKDKLPTEIRKMSRDGIHQCGTTRIAKDPASGVVDRDLRVHGTRNVYVCSSSAFPTSGQANPTFFLGMFAVRLAAMLSRQNA
jgi:choline dehydrogenase-like flavoprotein